MLIALDDGILEVRCLTEKGRRLFAGADRAVGPRRPSEPRARPRAVRPGRGGRVPGRRLRRPAVAGLAAALPRLRGLRLHLPDLPLLRHRRRRQRGGRRAGAELGRLPVRPCSRCTPRATTRGASRPSGSGSGSTTSSASIREKFGDVALHRLRQLHAELPRRPGRAVPCSKHRSPARTLEQP